MYCDLAKTLTIYVAGATRSIWGVLQFFRIKRPRDIMLDGSYLFLLMCLRVYYLLFKDSYLRVSNFLCEYILNEVVQ